MDYFVPEKMPQSKNVLESLVWDREKDIDKMRERFQLARALSQAKLSEAKYVKRNLFSAVREASNARKTATSSVSSSKCATNIPPVLLELNKASLNNGNLEDNIFLNADSFVELAKKCESYGIVGIGTNPDVFTYKGAYEDLELLKFGTNLPVFCNDFVVYGYQVFKTKSSGADVLKLSAAVLSTQDLIYTIKISKAFGLKCVVVVSSKVQLLEVLNSVKGVEAISVTSRNMKLWKIDKNKASRILADAEVQQVIMLKKDDSIPEEERLLVFQEGFTDKAELVEAQGSGLVDGIFLGEELLREKNKSLDDILQMWIL